MPVPEEDVLHPLDPSMTDSDDWEVFTLNDARVVHESNGKPASLLSAYADTPLKVIGRLDPPSRGRQKFYVQRQSKAAPIDVEIRSVTRYSYGEMTDGAFVIWAQGKAGWFEIRPTASYKRIHEDMIEAVELLYFVTDIYSEPRKRGGGPSAQLVFQEYAEDERYACNDPAVAAEVFAKHHIFLMMSFLNRAQGTGWSNTPLYQYFRRQFPQDFESCKARVEGRYDQIQPEKAARKSKVSPAPTSKATPTTSKQRVARSKTESEQPKKAPKKDDNWWEAAALFEFMQKAVNHKAIKAGRGQITCERMAQLVVKRYEIEDEETARNVLLVHARNLCYMMAHPRRKNIQYFVDEPIYEELSAGHSLSASEQRTIEALELKPRKDHATLKADEFESSNSSDEEKDALTTPVRRPPGRRRNGRLSVLRPKSSQFSGKTKGSRRLSGKGKAPVRDPDLSSASSGAQESGDASDSEDGIISDTLTRVLSPDRLEKRKLDETDIDDTTEKARRKRIASEPVSPESPPTTAESEDEDEELAANVNIPLPLRHKSSSSKPSAPNTKPTIAPRLVSTLLPTYEANASRDSWICSFDGCSQRIYGCSKEIGQQLITEHLEDHVNGREKVVGILWREQDKLHLPVSNLIKKIREMSEASKPLFPAEGEEKVMPRPIQRPV